MAERKGYRTQDGYYYEGDRLDQGSVEVRLKPGANYTFDVNIGDWVPDAAAQKSLDNANTLAQISAKEAACIRPLRELMRATQLADVAPAVVTAAKAKLKQLDDDIAALRAQLK
jgi:hypothetical protein